MYEAKFRKMCTTRDLRAERQSIATAYRKVQRGEWQRVAQGVFLPCTEPATFIERAIAMALSSGGVISHSLAARLHDFDSAWLSEPFITIAPDLRRRNIRARYRALTDDEVTTIRGLRCTSGLRTLTDLAAEVDDIRWEHALEFALRKEFTTVAELDHLCDELGKGRTKGVARMRRVLQLRPSGAPPTESLLETLMVQLIRSAPWLPEPQRQVGVYNRWGDFVARVDLAWPERGVFIELDGQHHRNQPVYDSRRETAVVAATGWLPARFTWDEVTRIPKPTIRRLTEICNAVSFRRKIA
jgi:hypothetical protein